VDQTLILCFRRLKTTRAPSKDSSSRLLKDSSPWIRQWNPQLCKVTNDGLRRVSCSLTKIRANNQCACRTLRDEIRKLEQMASKGTLVRVLENEADRKAIEDIFKRIDWATKTFQVNPNLLSDYQPAHPSHPARHRLDDREKGE